MNTYITNVTMIDWCGRMYVNDNEVVTMKQQQKWSVDGVCDSKINNVVFHWR